MTRWTRRGPRLLPVAGLITAVLAVGPQQPATAQRGAQDEATRGPSGRLTVTVYTDGSGLIEDTRTLALRSGEQEVEWPGVPLTVDASSVHLSEPREAVRLLQQTFRLDTPEAGRALELARGRNVVVTTRDGKRFEGRLWAFDGGTVTLATSAGLALLQQANLISIETPMPGRPLQTQPALRWRLWARRDGSTPVTAAYLANGLSWHADYDLVLDGGEKSGRLAGAASVDNSTGVDLEGAAVRLVAGTVRRVPSPRPPVLERFGTKVEAAQSADMGFASAPVSETPFADYHLYTLSDRVTLFDKETRKVALFDDATVEPQKIYRFDPARHPSAILAELAITNTTRGGPGVPLPGGRVRVYGQVPGGGTALLGEDLTGHVAVGDTLRVTVGAPFDLGVTRTMTDEQRISDRESQQTWRAVFRNRKSEDVTILWDEHIPGRDWTVTQASQRYVKKSADTVEFTVRVPAGKETTVTYTARWTY